ncbi:cbb3-type cytochrome oxidase assembly protein CcoS [Marilutibacter aestuarii]|uniref:Cbb3-type cytochrome oxidase assembly protein CcoS n=1 Tax=Marilutibacter aestuarii TaxID=1706195 RepID=A0A508ATC0_9GAMM|nr:cbb3-type cytochrome oxidase assembly protein CcoS [Lysobacter aestuarii]TQD50968.1 cbb3-type cytochrome oxidase assembly protein CcoS [Lysobacter aestuarii]
MTVLLLLIPLSLGLLVAAIWAFVWAVRKGQFDDLDTPALDILREDPLPRPRNTPEANATPDGDRNDGAA